MNSWKTFTLTFKGRRHADNGEPCQDSVYGHSSGNYVIVALSDGAGSMALSNIGSKITVNTFGNYMKANFDRVYEKDDGHLLIIERINYNLQKHAQKSKTHLQDYSSTLIGIAVKDDRFFFIHIGDGIAGLEDQRGIRVLSTGFQGEFANETYFVNSPNIKDYIIIKKGVIHDDVLSFFIMSDGAMRILYDRKKNTFANAVVKILKWMDKYEPNRIRKNLIISLRKLPQHYLYDDFSIGIARRI